MCHSQRCAGERALLNGLAKQRKGAREPRLLFSERGFKDSIGLSSVVQIRLCTEGAMVDNL